MKALILLFITIPLFVFESSLTDNLDAINESLEKIETDKEIITQSLNYDENVPFNVDISCTWEKVKDGKLKTQVSSLNMALLNEKRVIIKTGKKEMLVILETSRGKFIQVTEDNESKGYSNKLEIQCIDIDAARDLKEMLESAIIQAQESWEESINLPTDLNALKSWLAEHIGDINLEKKTISQSIESDEKLEDYIIVYTEDSKSEESKQFQIPLAEIEVKSLKASASKDIITLEIKSKVNKKVFKETNSKKGDSFINKIQLQFEGATSALEFAKALEKSIPPSEEILAKRIEDYANCEDCITTLVTSVNEYQSEKINTELIGDCEALFTIIDSKGKEKVFQYNWADLNSSSIKENYNSDKLIIKVTTLQKNKFITKLKEGEVDGYGNQLEFNFSNLEEMQKSLITLADVIDNCELSFSEEDIEWINDRWEESEPINELNQAITQAEDDDCSISMTSYKEGSDKVNTYEFNLNDLNVNSIKLKISGSKLQLEAATNGKEKVINVTDQDGKLEYTNKLTMSFADINHLRVAEMTLKEEVEGCKN